MELGPLALIKPGAARSDYSIPADDSREVIREGGVGEELVVNALRCRAGGRRGGGVAEGLRHRLIGAWRLAEFSVIAREDR
jgi:hypothetical protein